MPNFKDVVFFPSLSSQAGYFIKNEEIAPGLKYRFYDEDSIDNRFIHKFFLISAGIHYKKKDIREQMGLNNGSLVMGDSGGFQIASGALKWSDKLRQEIFEWLENNADLSVNIDIPPRQTFEGRFQDALDISYDNFKYFAENQSGKTTFLSVIQSNESIDLYDVWYKKVKGFDFGGWCVGGGGTSLKRMLYGFATLLQNREFENKNNKWVHFLGQTTPRDFFIYNIIQRNFDTKGYEHVTVTTDSSSPVQATVYGTIFHSVNYEKLTYRYIWFDKSLNYDTKDNFPSIINTPITKHVKMEDLKSYSTLARHQLAFHNIFMFQHFMKEIKSLCSSDFNFLKEFLSKDGYLILKSINEMFETPEHAQEIVRKYSPIYDKFSQKEVKFTDNVIFNELFEQE